MSPELRAAITRLRTEHTSNYTWASSNYRSCPVCMTSTPCDVLIVIEALEAAHHTIDRAIIEADTLQRMVASLTATSPRHFKTGEPL